MHKRSNVSRVNLYIPTTKQRLEGRLLGFTTWTQQNSSVAPNHCTVHRQALASSKLHETTTEAVKATYFTETWRRNTRLIRKFCAEMDSEHSQCTSQCIRWLSRGVLLKRLFESRHKIYLPLKDTTALSSHSDDPGSVGLRILQKHFQNYEFLILKCSSTWK